MGLLIKEMDGAHVELPKENQLTLAMSGTLQNIWTYDRIASLKKKTIALSPIGVHNTCP